MKLALEGSLGPHQLLMLEKQLSHIDQLNELITELDEEVERRMSPFAEDLKLLDTIPGVGKRTAEQILAEIGTDMTRFPSAGHLCSWAGMTPGHDESAGKKRSARTRKGNKKLRSALVESARAAGRKRIPTCRPNITGSQAGEEKQSGRSRRSQHFSDSLCLVNAKTGI